LYILDFIYRDLTVIIFVSDWNLRCLSGLIKITSIL
jgi:hypothetical protein